MQVDRGAAAELETGDGGGAGTIDGVLSAGGVDGLGTAGTDDGSVLTGATGVLGAVAAGLESADGEGLLPDDVQPVTSDAANTAAAKPDPRVRSARDAIS